MSKRIALVLGVSVMFCAQIFADQVTLKNGDRLSGTITKLDNNSLNIKTDYAGEVKIQWTAVAKVSSDQPLYVTLKDKRVVLGIVVMTDSDTIEILTKDAGKVSVAKDAVQLIHSRETEEAFQAETRRLNSPRMSGSLDAGFSTTRGNARTTNLAIGAQAARVTRKDKLSGNFASLFASNGTSGVSITTANAIRSGLRYDRNINERLFSFGLTEIERDRFQQLDLRLVLGGGLGYHFRKTERTKLDLFTGGSLNRQYFSTGLRRSTPEILFGNDLSYNLTNNVSLTERGVIYPSLSQLGQYRVTFDSTVVTKVTKLFGFQVTVSDRFLSNPIPGVKKNDLLLSTGIRLTFGDTASGK